MGGTACRKSSQIALFCNLAGLKSKQHYQGKIPSGISFRKKI